MDPVLQRICAFRKEELPTYARQLMNEGGIRCEPVLARTKGSC